MLWDNEREGVTLPDGEDTRYYRLQFSWINGWRFHTDGVHMNSRGAMIAAELVQEFIDR